jgi:uncharacterized protein YjgD (DUF1641 family)
MMVTATTDRTEVLERKVDALGEQIAFLVDQAEVQAHRRQQWEDLSSDAMPLAKAGMERLSTELDAMTLDSEVMLDLVRRLAANVENLERLLVALESGLDLVGDAKGLASEAMAALTARLEELDRRGYFTFMEAGFGVVDRVITNFSEEDVNQLGDNVVLILETVKEMTQPEIMAVLYRMIEAIERQRLAIEAETEEAPSLWQLARMAREPEVRRGLGRALATLRAVAAVETGPPRKFVAGTEDQSDKNTQGGDS